MIVFFILQTSFFVVVEGFISCNPHSLLSSSLVVTGQGSPVKLGQIAHEGHQSTEIQTSRSDAICQSCLFHRSPHIKFAIAMSRSLQTRLPPFPIGPLGPKTLDPKALQKTSDRRFIPPSPQSQFLSSPQVYAHSYLKFTRIDKMGFRTLLTLATIGLAAAETTVVNLFIFDADPQSLVGSVLASVCTLPMTL